MEQKQVKGLLLIDAVAFLKERKGEAAVTDLETSAGTLLFDQYRMYPVEDLLKIHRAVIQKIYGSDSSEAGYKELGIFTFKAFTQSVVGATLMNVAHSPKELLEKIEELWNAVVNFGSRTVLSVSNETKNAVVKIVDDPREPSYLQGVIEAGLASINIHATTAITNKQDNTYTITIQW